VKDVAGDGRVSSSDIKGICGQGEVLRRSGEKKNRCNSLRYERKRGGNFFIRGKKEGKYLDENKINKQALYYYEKRREYSAKEVK